MYVCRNVSSHLRTVQPVSYALLVVLADVAVAVVAVVPVHAAVQVAPILVPLLLFLLHTGHLLRPVLPHFLLAWEPRSA